MGASAKHDRRAPSGSGKLPRFRHAYKDLRIARTQGRLAVGDSRTTVFGVAAPEETVALSGRAILQAMIDGGLPAPPIAETLAFLLTEVGEGFAVFEGETAANLRNPMGSVHGGWALTLIDSATTCAALSLLPPGVGCTTVETKANFARPIFADTGRVRAEGRVVTQGRRLLTAEAKVTDARGRVLAHGTSTLMTVSADL
jgi:uncharacterized protein (TIGR00369 family)